MSRERKALQESELEAAELERLLAEVAPEERDRESIREAHRQLEKDLLRLADPLPPADFVSTVMKKVESQPRPVPASEFVSAFAIVSVALIGSIVAFLASGASANGVAISFAQTLMSTREVAVGCGSALSAVWSTAGVPLSLVLCMVVMLSLVGFRRLLTPANARVVP